MYLVGIFVFFIHVDVSAPFLSCNFVVEENGKKKKKKEHLNLNKKMQKMEPKKYFAAFVL